MSSAKVLLAFCNQEGPSTPPLGITSMATHLLSHGYKARIFDDAPYMMDLMDDRTDPRERNLSVVPTDHSLLHTLPHENKMSDFMDLVAGYQPHIVGVSTSRYGFLNGLEYLKRVKEDFPEILTIVGGAFAMSTPETVIAYDCVDMVAIGDGEHVLEELCARLAAKADITDVPGIWVKDAKGFVHKNPLHSLFNPDDVGPLRFDLYDERRFYRPIGGQIRRCLPLEISRGCPYNCTNCSVPLFAKNHRRMGKWFRIKSVSQIEKDIKTYLKYYDPEYFFFMSPTFLGFPRHYTEEFIAMYRKYRIPFYMFTRPEQIRKETLRRLLAIGLNRMAVGVECGNETYRRHMLNRKYSNARIKEKFEILKKLDIPVSTNIIIGLPDETEEMILESIRLIKAIKSHNVAVNVSIYQAYENTPLYNYCVQKNYYQKAFISQEKSTTPTINSPYLTDQKILHYFHLFNYYVNLDESDWPRLAPLDGNSPQDQGVLQELVATKMISPGGVRSQDQEKDALAPEELVYGEGDGLDKPETLTPYSHC